MFRALTIGCCLILILIASQVQAELDQYDQKALQQTQELLKNPSERNKAIANDKAAKDIDAKTGSLAGSAEKKEEIYSIAAQVMEKITKDANGDPEKMKKLLQEAQSNPEAFYNKFDSSQKSQIQNLAGKIEAQKVPVPSR